MLNSMPSVSLGAFVGWVIGNGYVGGPVCLQEFYCIEGLLFLGGYTLTVTPDRQDPAAG